MVVDFESSELGSLSKAQNDADLAAFDATLNQAGYNKTDLYTMASWLGVNIDTNAANNGWIADYPNNPTGSKYTSANAWQWASDYRFPSITQNLDVSQMNNDYYLNSTVGTPTNTATNTTPTTNSSSSSVISSSSSSSSSTTGSKSSTPGEIVKVPDHQGSNTPPVDPSRLSSFGAAVWAVTPIRQRMEPDTPSIWLPLRV